LEQKRRLAGIESGRDVDDGRLLIVGRRKFLAGLNQLVSDGDGLTIGVDRRPDVDVGR
jgi:hypothetical protein